MFGNQTAKIVKRIIARTLRKRLNCSNKMHYIALKKKESSDNVIVGSHIRTIERTITYTKLSSINMSCKIQTRPKTKNFTALHGSIKKGGPEA